MTVSELRHVDNTINMFTGLQVSWKKCPLLVSHFAVKVTARSRKWSLLPCNVNYKLLYPSIRVRTAPPESLLNPVLQYVI